MRVFSITPSHNVHFGQHDLHALATRHSARTAMQPTGTQSLVKSVTNGIRWLFIILIPGLTLELLFRISGHAAIDGEIEKTIATAFTAIILMTVVLLVGFIAPRYKLTSAILASALLILPLTPNIGFAEMLLLPAGVIMGCITTHRRLTRRQQKQSRE